jgi:hypothetical protein
MSDTFREREESYEAKYKMDEERRFKTEARRNKLLGLWAAERMGMTPQEAEAFAKDVVLSDLEEPGVADVVRKVLGVSQKRGANLSEEDIRQKMDHFYAIAIKQLDEEYPEPLGGDHSRVGN